MRVEGPNKENSMTLFEKATRKKYRFPASMGNVTTEDLWDLPLEQLDKIARELHTGIKDGAEVSFIDEAKPTAAHTLETNKLDVVKRVIEVKLADKERAEKTAVTKAKKQRILSLLDEKQDEELKGKSTEELEELLDAL